MFIVNKQKVAHPRVISETSHGFCGLDISLDRGRELKSDISLDRGRKLKSATAYSATISVELRVHAVPIAKALRTQMSVLCLFQPRRKVMSQEQLKILS